MFPSLPIKAYCKNEPLRSEVQPNSASSFPLHWGLPDGRHQLDLEIGRAKAPTSAMIGRVHERAMRSTTIIFGVMVLSTGCSSEVEKDLVGCKASAVETNRQQMSGEKLATYLRECMRDKG